MSEPSLFAAPDRNIIQQIIHALRQAPVTALIGLAIVSVYVVAAVFAPWIAPYGEYEVVSEIPFAPWSEANLLGTDQLGRDFLTRIIYGARNSIGIAFVTTLLAFAIGVSEKIVQLEGRDLGELVRGLLAAVVRRDAGYPDELLPAMHRANEQLMVEMRRPPPDRSRRYVIFPLVAGVAEAPGRSGTSVF